MLKLKSVDNFRESGGFPTDDEKLFKQNIIYRSGSLDRINKTDLGILYSLGIKTNINLYPAKNKRETLVNQFKFKRIHIPFDIDETTSNRLKPFLKEKNAQSDIEKTITAVYKDMVDELQEEVGKVFKILASPEIYPVLINCRLGKDRTGFICALIQMAAGVKREYILADYTKSNDFYLPKAKTISAVVKVFSLGFFPTGNFITAFTSMDKYICAVMDKIESKFGGIGNYLERCGLSQDEFLTQLERFLTKNRLFLTFFNFIFS